MRIRISAALAILSAAAVVTFGATGAPADTGAACAAAYTVGWQTPSNSPPDFGATVTVTNNSSYTISTWTIRCWPARSTCGTACCTCPTSPVPAWPGTKTPSPITRTAPDVIYPVHALA